MIESFSAGTGEAVVLVDVPSSGETVDSISILVTQVVKKNTVMASGSFGSAELPQPKPTKNKKTGQDQLQYTLALQISSSPGAAVFKVGKKGAGYAFGEWTGSKAFSWADAVDISS
ncbi:MAG: hypothetical protein JO186_00270 [Actinobacteria bacterium]|nr:hypothetical protein [Actinomycetota bacterium]